MDRASITEPAGHFLQRYERFRKGPDLLASGYSHLLARNGTYGFELLQKPYLVEELSHQLRRVAARRGRERL